MNWDFNSSPHSSHFAVRNNKCISNRPQTKVREKRKAYIPFHKQKRYKKTKNKNIRKKNISYVHKISYSKSLSSLHNLFYTYIIPIYVFMWVIFNVSNESTDSIFRLRKLVHPKHWYTPTGKCWCDKAEYHNPKFQHRRSFKSLFVSVLFVTWCI
jgi:hypothetical protein